MTRYLTKSRFKVAYECPAKLFYNEQPSVYGNKNRENEFLKALAQGGFQVGALAKIYYPEGIDLEGLRSEEAIQKTSDFLQQERVTLFEAAVQNGPFLVRVDVLIKNGAELSLIEVKSKSYDSSEGEGFFKKRDPGIDGKWEPYLIDVSFQTWVLQQAYPNCKISSYLLLPDKAARATVDGLHQHFRLDSRDQKSGKVIVREGLTEEALGSKILKEVPVDKEVAYLITQELFPTGEKLPEFAKYLAQHHKDQSRALARLTSICKSCEFRIDDTFKTNGRKSAFEECWTSAGKLSSKDHTRPMIFDIWKLHHTKTQAFVASDKIFFDQLVEEDLKPKSKPKKTRTLQPYQRQWLQIEKALNGDIAPYVNQEGLQDLFDGVNWPIHCIDFETSMVAIPFHKGRRPYEQIAFQFSHHVLHEDGSVAHVDQYLDVRPGVFPNFDFVRRLKQSLSGDQGTIFRYATHENTVLRQIRDQLVSTPQPDQEELITFIDSITKPRDKEPGEPGRRNMVDLLEIVLENYYHPLMGGSNSIKKVIPAVLEESVYLRDRYSKGIYGRGLGVPSLNFERMNWIDMDPVTGKVKDPYKALPPVFSDIDMSEFDGEGLLFLDDSIDDGGAAMTAWSRMQFTEMSVLERTAIQSALLKYCELDTLSMVWLLEYWRSLLSLV